MDDVIGLQNDIRFNTDFLKNLLISLLESSMKADFAQG